MTTTMSTWKDLPRRILTVTVGVPSIILLLRNPVTAWLFFQGAHLLCLLEWRALAPDAGRTAPAGKTAGVDSEGSGSLIHRLRARILLEGTSEDTPLRRLMFCVFVAASIIATIAPTELLPLVAMAHGVALRLAPHLPRFRRRDCVDSTGDEVNALLGMQHYLFGSVYISLGFHFILKVLLIGGPAHVGNLLFIVWMSDTGALIAGRAAKTKKVKTDEGEPENEETRGAFLSFVKSISPGKTLPGLFGAVLTGPLSAMCYASLAPNPLYRSGTFLSCVHGNLITQQVLAGLALSTVGIVGDLAESSVKRTSKKKDSGGLLPGHGGVVDRFDSLFVAGTVYYYISLLPR